MARETDTDTALLRRARHDERVGERGDGVVSERTGAAIEWTSHAAALRLAWK